MNFKELFIDKSKTLIVNTDLALVLGDLNEAIVLNQLNYWLEINKKAEKNLVDGKYWVYNSYSDWRINNFPYWSEKTIQRTFTRLENKGIVISANYNKLAIDKTKWYTIDTEKLQELVDKFNSDEDKMTNRQDSMTDRQDNMTYRGGQNDRPLPEITTENINRDYNSENTNKVNTSDASDVRVNTFPTGKGVSGKLTRKQLKEKQDDMIKRFDYICNDIAPSNPVVRECVKRTFKKYIDRYNEHTGKIHPILEDKTLYRVFMILAGCESSEYSPLNELETYTPCDGTSLFEDLVDLHFTRKHRQETDWSIVHFANAEYLDKLASGLI